MKTFDLRIRDIPDVVLASVMDWIERHTVLLIHRDHLAGSGTFVRCNNLFGILTAHHVVEKNHFDFRPGASDRLGLCVDKREHKLSFPMDYLTRIDVGVPVTEEEGPDMTFLGLPPGSELGTIMAKKSFWNLDHNRRTRIDICNSSSGAWCLSYHADERTQLEHDKEGIILSFPASVGWGGPRRTYEMHGFDFYEMGLDPANLKKGIPDWFGGASGGGVWKVPLSGTKDKIQTGTPVLAGLIYYQTKARTLLCHGPMSIYKRLYETLNAVKENSERRS